MLELYSPVPEYNIYSLMKDGFTRSEAEVLVKTYEKKVSFTEKLKNLYGYNL